MAHFLIKHTDVDTASVEELTATLERLNGLTDQLLGQWNAADTHKVCRGMEQLARALRLAEPDTLDVQQVALISHALGNVGISARHRGELDEAVARLREAAELSIKASDPLRTATAYRLLANAEFVGSRDGTDRRASASAAVHIRIALKNARRKTSRAALLAQVACLTQLAQLTTRPDELANKREALREAAAILSQPDFRGILAQTGSIFGLLMDATELATMESNVPAEERFLASAIRCRTEVRHHIVALGNLSVKRLNLGDSSGAAQAACQALRLDQEYSVPHEGVSLLRLAYCAHDIEGGQFRAFAILAEESDHAVAFVSQSSEVAAAGLWRCSGSGG